MLGQRGLTLADVSPVPEAPGGPRSEPFSAFSVCLHRPDVCSGDAGVVFKQRSPELPSPGKV